MTTMANNLPKFGPRITIGNEWEEIRQDHCSLLLEPRDACHLDADILTVIDVVSTPLIGHGQVNDAIAMLGKLPAAIERDIRQLAARFAQLLGVETIRIRLEHVSGNSCRKVHTDRTDLRLITTYFGPGTQVLLGERENREEELWMVPTGWVGLFKGTMFGDGHQPCPHRSPPAGDMGVGRLLLVIDSPRFANGQWASLETAA